MSKICRSMVFKQVPLMVLRRLLVVYILVSAIYRLNNKLINQYKLKYDKPEMGKNESFR